MSLSNLINIRDIVNILVPFTPESVLMSLARFQGNRVYRNNLHLRNAVYHNIKTCYPGKFSHDTLESVVRQWFIFKHQKELLVFTMSLMRPGRLERVIPIEGLEYLDHALENGRGAVLMGSHLNSIAHFLGIYRLRKMGYDAHAVMPTQDDPFKPSKAGLAIMRMTGEGTLLDQIGAFYAQFNIRPILRSLSGNGVALLLGDGFHSTAFVPVNFMGRKVNFTTGPVAVARISGAALLPTFMVGDSPDQLKMIIGKPLHVTEESGKDHDAAIVQQYASLLQHYVEQYTSGWQHWEFENILDLMERILDTSLQDRLTV
ncbi:MAG: hypothetical protein GXP23_11595 [Gammaproteobacteria bacterium]|nr:hypothetical protein [Gammaproteobacteria bacterium]